MLPLCIHNTPPPLLQQIPLACLQKNIVSCLILFHTSPSSKVNRGAFKHELGALGCEETRLSNIAHTEEFPSSNIRLALLH